MHTAKQQTHSAHCKFVLALVPLLHIRGWGVVQEGEQKTKKKRRKFTDSDNSVVVIAGRDREWVQVEEGVGG